MLHDAKMDVVGLWIRDASVSSMLTWKTGIFDVTWRVCSISVRTAACPCTRAIDRSSHAVYRSILVLTSLAYTERCVQPAPIRTPERSSCLSDQRRILDVKTWHAWTRTPPRNIVWKAVFFLIHFPVSLIRLWPSCHSDFRGSRHGWGLFVGKTESLKVQLTADLNRT